MNHNVLLSCNLKQLAFILRSSCSPFPSFQFCLHSFVKFHVLLSDSKSGAPDVIEKMEEVAPFFAPVESRLISSISYRGFPLGTLRSFACWWYHGSGHLGLCSGFRRQARPVSGHRVFCCWCHGLGRLGCTHVGLVCRLIQVHHLKCPSPWHQQQKPPCPLIGLACLLKTDQTCVCAW